MLKESWKVFGVCLSCLIGAGLGTFIALEVNPLFWWVGPIVGGLTGYLSYEWRKVGSAVLSAYSAAHGVVIPAYFWREMGLGLLVGFSFFLWAFLFCAGMDYIIPSRHSSWWSTALIMGLLVMVIGLVMGAFSFNDVRVGYSKNEASTFECLRCLAWNFWPPYVAFLLVGALVALAVNILVSIPCWIKKMVLSFVRLGIFIKCFVVQVFLRIHSEMRLLCGVDSLLGACVGYHFGSVVLGSLAGAIFGLLNYVVVTKGWLEPKGYLPLSSK